MREICFSACYSVCFRKELGCTDALLTISLYLQKALDTGIESCILQLDFSAAFDRVSHNGLLLKLKSYGAGGSGLSICREFHSNRGQRVVVEGTTSERIPIVSGVSLGRMFSPLLFFIYTSEIF